MQLLAVTMTDSGHFLGVGDQSSDQPSERNDGMQALWMPRAAAEIRWSDPRVRGSCIQYAERC